MELDQKKIRKLRKAFRIEYEKITEHYKKLGEMAKASDLLLDTIENVYEFYGGNEDEK